MQLPSTNQAGIGTLWLVFLAIVGGGFASESAVAENAEAKSRYLIEEITVTARRREEGLQNAPIAVTAMTGVELENRGALDVVDFADAAPNVTLEPNGRISGFGAAPRTSIRGVGQSDFVINTDPAVGLYADDVYIGRSLGSLLDLLDVERVEALRGPQGTLFGRNSTGGAINVIAAKPNVEDGFNGKVSAAFGEEGYLLLRGGMNVPLSDSAALRVNAFKRERDGFIPALQFDGVELGEEDVIGVRAAFRWQPTDSLTIDADTDYSERNDSPAPMVAVELGDLSVGEPGLSQTGPRVSGESTSIFSRVFNRERATPSAPPKNQPWLSTDPQCASNQVYRDATPACIGNYWAGSRNGTNAMWFDREGNPRKPEQSLDTYGYALRITWETEAFTLKSITAKRGFDSSFFNSSPAVIITSGNQNEQFDQDQFSQEVHLDGSLMAGWFDWLLGAFYMDEDGYERVAVVGPYPPPSFNNDVDFLPLMGIENRYIDNESRAVFGQGIARITEDIRLTLGLRRTEDEKAGRFVLNENNLVDSRRLSEVQSAKETNVLANLSWDINDDIMVYAQFADGFRDGGFPSRQPPGTTELLLYDPEYVDSFELGIKMTSLEGQLRTNAAIFSMEYTDMQIGATVLNPVAGTITPSVSNLGDSTLSGFELEVNFVAMDNLRFDLSVGYLHNEIDSLETGGLIINNGSNLRKVVTTDMDLPFAPDWQVNLGVNYSHFFGNGAELRGRMDYFYEAEQYTSIANYRKSKLPSTSKVNLLVSYIPSDANWSIIAGARNLTDEEDITNVDLNVGLGNGLYHVFARGREAYLQVEYSFDGR